MRGKRFAKERLRSGNAPIRSQHEVYAAPLLVHGSIQIVPSALDRDVSLVNAPGTTDRAGKSIPALLKFRNIPNYLSHDRCVRNDHTALGHHRNEISVAQAIADVAAHAQNNDLGVELALHIDCVTVLAFGHRASPSATNLADARCCTGTGQTIHENSLHSIAEYALCPSVVFYEGRSTLIVRAVTSRGVGHLRSSRSPSKPMSTRSLEGDIHERT